MQFEEYGLLDAILCSVIERCNFPEKMTVSIFITEERDVWERRVQTRIQKQEEKQKPILRENQWENVALLLSLVVTFHHSIKHSCVILLFHLLMLLHLSTAIFFVNPRLASRIIWTTNRKCISSSGSSTFKAYNKRGLCGLIPEEWNIKCMLLHVSSSSLAGFLNDLFGI